jgi:integrase/recombinase XerD
MRNRYTHRVSIYIREQKVSTATGKPYWGFEPIKPGKGRKPATGAFYVRHMSERGKQQWLPAGQSYTEAAALRDKLTATKLAHRSGLTIEQAEDLENVGRVSVKEAVEDFLKAKEHKAKRTVAAYRLALNCFLDCLPHRVRFLDEVTEATVRHFVDSMTTAGLSPKTVKNRVLIVSFLLKRMGSKVKTKWAELPTIESQPVRAFSQDDLRKVFSAMDEEQHAAFCFFLGTGCREQEVSHAEWSDVDFQHRIFTVRAKAEWGFAPKSHEARQIPIPEELVTMLRERKKQASAKLIFPNRDNRPNGHFLRVLKRIAFRSGLNCGHCTGTTSKLTHEDKNRIVAEYQQKPDGPDSLTAKLNATKKLSCKAHPVCEQWYLHRFRKTFATKMHHAGMPLRDLQRILGHKSLVTTEQYLAESDLKAAHMRKFADEAFSF